MNLTTVLVTLVIAGSATPGIAKLALQPVIAQKRATNFGVAEMQAVTFAAKNEGKTSLTKIPEQCGLDDIGNNAFTITCWEGKRKYRMVATRAFRQGTSSEIVHKTTETQPSEDKALSERKLKTAENQSREDGTSGKEKNKMPETQSSKHRKSIEEKRKFPYPTPSELTHYNCPHFDPWGVVSFNKTHLDGKACIPIPLQSPDNFAESKPADWLYDISGFGM